MRARWQLTGISLACLLLLAAAPAARAREGRVFRAPEARPTDHPDPDRHSYTAPQAPKSPACSEHFCVHWVARGPDRPPSADSDGDGVPDFIEQVLEVAERVYTVENVEMGWQPPESDGRKGGGRGKTDVYLADLGGSLFGYAAPDRGQASKAHRLPRRLYGYLVLDNDYNPFQFPGTKPVDDLEVTFAHEYSHILQFGYDTYQDPWMAESTATWMEDQVYPEINDYLRYVRRWVNLYNTPLTTPSIREYGSAVWNLWLSHRYGQSIVRKLWATALKVKPGGFSVAVYNRVIKAVGSSQFSRDFARFARDVAEWRTSKVFSEGWRYPDMTRQGTVRAGGPPVDRTLNHTTFQDLRVEAAHGRAVVVNVSAPRGVASALALVGRIGGEREGEVISKMRFKRGGGRLTVRLSRPGRFSRLTAVVVNADAAAAGFSPRLLDWNYLTDTAPFRVRAELAR